MPNDDGQTTLPEPTLREQLAENLQNVTDSTQETVEKPVETETPEQKAGRTAGRERDEAGRLLPGKPKQVVPSAVAPVTASVVTPATPVPIKRPSTWAKETWPVYDKLASGIPLTPEEAKQITDTIHKRESDFASGVSTYKNEWDQAKPLIDAVAPFMQELQQNNINPAQWISNLGNSHRLLVHGQPQEKLAMMQQLVRDYNIPAQLAVQGQDGNWQLLQQLQPQQQPQQQQPDVRAIIKAELMQQASEQEVNTFSAQTEKYPHFEAVKQTMAGLLQAGLADDLSGAYEAALRHPRHADLFEAVQQQAQELEKAKAAEVQKQKVLRARSNAVSTPSATPSGSGEPAGDKGLREQLQANLREVVGGRV